MFESKNAEAAIRLYNAAVKIGKEEGLTNQQFVMGLIMILTVLGVTNYEIAPALLMMKGLDFPNV